MTGVTSYQDVHDCLKLVMDSLSYGDLKPWVCRMLLYYLIIYQTPKHLRVNSDVIKQQVGLSCQRMPTGMLQA